MDTQPTVRARVAMLRLAVASAPDSSDALFALSTALAETGNAVESADAFRRAFIAHPCARHELFPGVRHEYDARVMRDRAAGLIDNGAAFSSVIAALAVAEALLGRVDEVRRLVDYDRFFRRDRLPGAAGSDSVFFRALEGEIRSHLIYHTEPRARAIRHAWRGEGVLSSDSPACRIVRHAIRQHVEEYAAELSAHADHPFVKARPERFVLDGWAIVSNGESYHRLHVHPRAWASGVYYVMQPPAACDADRRGWLQISAPKHLGVTRAHGWEERWVPPEPGTIVMMPGYFFHGTHPMGVDAPRICIAFDVVPGEIAASADDAPEYY